MQSPLTVFWFRRDLRLHDNRGLAAALSAGRPVLAFFIFDTEILRELEPGDRRVSFIYDALEAMQQQLIKAGSSLVVLHGFPTEAFRELTERFPVEAVYFNHDYEPGARRRDELIAGQLKAQGISVRSYKDQVLFEKSEVVKDDGRPYLVYTPYYKRWRALLQTEQLKSAGSENGFPYFYKMPPEPWPGLEELGFKSFPGEMKAGLPEKELIANYHKTRDIPALAGTTRFGAHLRFGTISIRNVAAAALEWNETFLKELCWREFFMQLLWHFPNPGKGFKPAYDRIAWRDDEDGFALWSAGRTGYPLVDAGMRELAATGFMHNRVRMVAASFLCKHLLIDWRWGEALFAQQLLDFDLAANNGNWQWVAGCGCDAAPYFRIFNPALQAARFDPDEIYIRRWIPEHGTDSYPKPMVEHKFATARCISAYKKALDPQQPTLFP